MILRPKPNHSAVTALLIFFLISGPAFGQMYKWTDANGNVHFSDSKPAEVKKTKSFQVIEDKQSSKTVAEAAFTTRDTSKAARPILITPPRLPWDAPQWDKETKENSKNGKQNVGLYHFGKSCVSPTAMIMPDAQRLHPRLFPSSATIGGLMTTTLHNNGYASFWRPGQSSDTRGKFQDAIKINTRITDMKYQVCTKVGSHTYRNTSISSFSYTSFAYKKVSMTATWTISNNSGAVLGTFSSRVNETMWQKDRGYLSVFTHAFDRALAQLFVNEEFLTLLHDGYTAPQLETASSDENTSVAESLISQSSNFYDQIRGKFSAYAGFQKQAQLSEVLTTLQQVKSTTIQHYMDQGRWPSSLEQVGLSGESYASNSDIIDRLYTGGNGAITAELNKSFGEDSMMILRPRVSRNSVISWHCTSNIKAEHLPSSLDCGPLY